MLSRVLRKIKREYGKRSGFPIGSLKSKSDAFYNSISRHTKIQQVATGFIFTEGPVWIESEKCLLFSDIPDNKIWKLSIDGTLSVFRKPSSNSNGLTLDRQECLIACEHSNRRVTRTKKDGSITVLADK